MRSKSCFDLPVGVLGQTDREGLRDALEPGGDVDPVAHQVAIALLDNIAQMNADPEIDALNRRQAGVALDHACLHLDRAADGVDHAAELDDDPIARPFDDPPMVEGDGRINEIAAESPKARKSTLLIGAGEPAIANNIRGQDRRKFARLAHVASHGVATLAQMPAPMCLFSTEGTLLCPFPSVPGANRKGPTRGRFRPSDGRRAKRESQVT